MVLRLWRRHFPSSCDKDPDIAELSRFAPTVTTSNLQILIQAAVNRGYDGWVGDFEMGLYPKLAACDCATPRRAGVEPWCSS